MKFTLLCFLVLLILVVCKKTPGEEMEDKKKEDIKKKMEEKMEKYCKRTIKSKCNPAQCVIKATSRCKTGYGAKHSELYFVLRRQPFPFFTIGAKNIDIDKNDGSDASFVKDSIRTSIGVWGLFEYEEKGSTTGFQVNEDRITEWYSFGDEKHNHGNKTKQKKMKMKWKDMKQKGKKISQEDLLKFTISPDYASMGITDEIPKFSLDCFSSSSPIVDPEEKIGNMKKMMLDPSSLKVSLNVTNSKCKNSSSTGIGVALFVVTKSGGKKKTKNDNDDNEMDTPNQGSDTNIVVADDEPEGGFFSFQKEVGVFNGTHYNSETVYYDIVDETEGKKFDVSMNSTNKEKLDCSKRKFQIVFISIPKCSIGNFFWDPAIGYGDLVEAEPETSFGNTLIYFNFMVLLVFFFILF